ncbi:unnamed protein product [Prunus brigantina]
MQSGYIASSIRTSPSPEMAPPPTQSAPYPTQSVEGAVVPVPPQIEDDDDDSVSEINSETKHRGPLGDYVVDSGKNGTSGMLNHIRKYCRYYLVNIDKNQKIISGDKSQGNKPCSQGVCATDILEACAEMIIIDELQFNFVKKKGFRKFCSVACHLFNVPSRRTIVKQFLKMYDEHKLKLKKDLRETRVCLTTWTTVQNCNYMVLTAHFIDCEHFVRMGKDEDNPFLAYFKELEHEVDEDGVVVSNNKHIRVGPPSEADWENATYFVKFLRVFFMRSH